MSGTETSTGSTLNKLKGIIGLPTGLSAPKPVATHPALERQHSFPEICSTPSDVGIFEVAHNKCRGADGKFSWRKFFFEAPSKPDTPRNGTAAAGAAASSGSQ